MKPRQGSGLRLKMWRYNNKSEPLTKPGRRGLFAAMALPKTDRQPTAGALPAAAEWAGVLQLVGMPGHFMKAVVIRHGTAHGVNSVPHVHTELGNGLAKIPVCQRRCEIFLRSRLGFATAFMNWLGAGLPFNRLG